MIRLILLTLVAMFAVLALWGDGDPTAAPRQQAAAPVASEPDAEPAPEPAAEIIPVATQTAPQVQEFPGPALQPSPEYAGDDTPAPTAEIVPAAGGSILYVTGNRVNFRAGPSTGDAVVGALARGSAVESIGPTNGGWVNIRDAQGRIGFMSLQFLSDQQPN